MKNNNAEKLKALPRGVIYDLKKILEIIDIFLIRAKPKPFIDDFFLKSRFNDFKEISVIKILLMLDKDFNIINFRQRKTGNGVHIGLKNENDETEFKEFQKLVDDIYTGPEAINKMTFVNPNETRFKIIINNDYSNWITADKNIQYWKLLSELAKNGFAIKGEYRSAYDQLNNVNKTPFKNEYLHTQIIKSEKDRITNNIDMEIISDKEFRIREEKQKM